MTVSEVKTSSEVTAVEVAGNTDSSLPDHRPNALGFIRHVSSLKLPRTLSKSSISNPEEATKKIGGVETVTLASSRSSTRRSSSLLSIIGLDGYWNKEMYEDEGEEKNSSVGPLFLLKDGLAGGDDDDDEKEKEALREIIVQHLDKLSDDSLVKICRQLDFWYVHGIKCKVLSRDDFRDLCRRLCDQSTWYHSVKLPAPIVPKVRFGKTNLQMPIITCGGMRFQHTWLPDIVPLLSESKESVLAKSPTQPNIRNIVRNCLQLGINHFETARFYGTSEYQLVQALVDLMEAGEIQRHEFIIQTKIVPLPTVKDFMKAWDQTWKHIGPKLQYIDLFTLHGLSNQEYWEVNYAEALKLKEQGKIRHIGFSTHGTSEQIMNLVNTEKFDFINIHYHFFGSYHGEGTPDTLGGHGNWACVKRAHELDMGIFCISPFDKGGKLYRPPKQMLLTLGHELTPISFASLHVWETAKMHTISVGFARPSDLDEVVTAARLFAASTNTSTESIGEVCAYSPNARLLLKSAEHRLRSRMEETCGKDWAEKGLLNLPTCYEECTSGIAIGHILWLHNLLTAYGMYDFCKDRYKMLEGNTLNPKKPFHVQVKKWPAFNGGRAFDDTVDLSKALSQHYNPALALKKLKECHGWLNSKNPPFTDEELEVKGWSRGYNLTVWEEFPGESITAGKVLLQAATRGRAGITGTGPTVESTKEASSLRSSFIRKVSV